MPVVCGSLQTIIFLLFTQIEVEIQSWWLQFIKNGGELDHYGLLVSLNDCIICLPLWVWPHGRVTQTRSWR